MFFLAPLAVLPLLALIPKRMGGLRAVVGIAGVICYGMALVTAFSRGLEYQNPNGKRRAARSGSSYRDFFDDDMGFAYTTGLPLDGDLADAEEDWNRDSGVI